MFKKTTSRRSKVLSTTTERSRNTSRLSRNRHLVEISSLKSSSGLAAGILSNSNNSKHYDQLRQQDENDNNEEERNGWKTDDDDETTSCHHDEVNAEGDQYHNRYRVPPILRLADIDKASETYWTWKRPWELLFVVTIVGLILGLSLVLLPFLVFGSLLRMYVVRYRSKYHTHPKDIRIAIVGAGWSGLQIMDRLLELGVTQIQGYERWDGIGGTWNPKAAYFNQAIHAPMYMSGFANHPYPDPHCKLRADQYQNYIKEFCETKQLGRFYHFNADVKAIHYDSKSNKAALDVQYNNDSIGQPKIIKTTPKEERFDLVLFTSFNSEPHIPVFPGQSEFQGEILHSMEFKQDVFERILKNKQKVVVIGGGKTSIDLLLSFQNAGYDQVAWVYRNPYMFSKMEFVFSAPSLIKVFHGLSFMASVFASLLSIRLAYFIMWCTGSVWTYDDNNEYPRGNGGYYRFKAAQMDSDQRRTMDGFDPNQKYHSGVRSLEARGIRLEDGWFVPADVVVLATSATSGLHRLQLTKDGLPFVLDPEEPLLHCFAAASFPVLGYHLASVSFGPQRSRASGDLAVYHCCVQEHPITTRTAQRVQRYQFGAPCKVQAALHFWETSSLYFLSSNMITFILTGMVDVFDMMFHMVKMLCFAKQDPFDLNILPPI